jgi:hypothetical protein
VASAIWLAVKDLDDVTIVKKSTYGSRYNQYYVDSADDAILTDYVTTSTSASATTGSASCRSTPRISGDYLNCEIYEN